MWNLILFIPESLNMQMIISGQAPPHIEKKDCILFQDFPPK
jgi:hypothetical protein